MKFNFAKNYKNLTELKNFSHIKIGEKYDNFYCPNNLDELKKLISECSNNMLNFVPIGGGSNILFNLNSEKILISENKMPRIIDFNNNQLIVSSNININQIISESVNRNLSGLEYLVTVPAHIGGCIKMNAGAFGKICSESLNWIEIITPDGILKQVNKEEINFNYRETSIEGFITKACFNLQPKSKKVIQIDIEKFIEMRKAKQPIDKPNLGCIFKNPPENSAGFLIDQCNLKGYQIGNVKISEKHANFFINCGSATSNEMLKLIDHVRNEVLKVFGVELELEIKVV